MKKITFTLVMVLALTAMFSTVALAGDHPTSKCSTKAASKCGPAGASAKCGPAGAAGCATSASVSIPDAPHKCCAEAAVAGKGCCGKDAKAVSASFASYNASQAALKDMHKCCAEAVVAGKGCCGKDATALKADYAQQVSTCSAVLGSMDKCCATAMVDGKGCCGKSASELKASVSGACDASKGASVKAASLSNKG